MLDHALLTDAIVDADLVVLLAAVVHLTADDSLLDRYDVGAFDHGRGPATLAPADADEIRALAVDVLGRVDPAELLARAPVSDDAAAPAHDVLRRRGDRRRLRRRRAGGVELRTRRPPPVRLGSHARPRRARRVPRRDHRRRARRDLRRHPPRTGRDPVHRLREERRGRRHVVREHLPRPPGRRAQPLLLVLVRAQPRLVRLLRASCGARRLHRALRRRLRRHPAPPARDRGDRRRLRRRPGALDAAGAGPDGRIESVEANAVDQRGGDAEPPVGPRPRRARHVRRACVPLVALGPHRRPPREAGRGRGHRRERDAVRARHRTRRRAPARSSSGRATGSPPTPRTTGR